MFVYLLVIRTSPFRHTGSFVGRTHITMLGNFEGSCVLVDFSDQESSTILNCLASDILRQYTTVTNQC